jgi:hypothetical protein
VCTHTNIQTRIHRMIHEYKSQRRNLIRDITPSQRCHTNIHPTPSSYRFNVPLMPKKKKSTGERHVTQNSLSDLQWMFQMTSGSQHNV